MHSKTEELQKKAAITSKNSSSKSAVTQGLQLPTVGTKRPRDDPTTGLPVIVSAANKRAKLAKQTEEPQNSTKTPNKEIIPNDSVKSVPGSKSLRDSLRSRALPPAFKASQAQREHREKKIERAKKRLAYVMQHMKEEIKSDLSSDQNVDLNAEDNSTKNNNNVNSSGGEMDDEPPDEEEMLIARLLLEGADEHLIREGFYQNVHKPVDQAQLYNTELTDADLNDEEFKAMIRDDKEVAALSVFYAQQDREQVKDECSAWIANVNFGCS